MSAADPRADAADAADERAGEAVVDGTPYRPGLDGLRGLAALWVLIYHAWIRTGAGPLDGLGLLAPIVRAGSIGVEIFFVLSGAVLALRLLDGGHGAAWRPFVARRAARLFPAVWVALLVACVTAPRHQATLGAFERGLTPESAVANATLLGGLARLVPGYHGAVGFAIDPVVWSLTPELLFSLAIPLVAPRLGRRLWWVVAALLGAGIALRIVGPSANLASVLNPLVTGFPVGVAVALVVRGGGRAVDRAPRLLVAGCAWLVLIVLTRSATSASGLRHEFAAGPLLPLLVSIACGAICLGLARSGAVGEQRGSIAERVAASRPLVALGRWSYGLYLWHFPLLGFLVWTVGVPADGSTRSFVLAAAGAIPLATVAGAASYRFIERPVRSRVARRLGAQARVAR